MTSHDTAAAPQPAEANTPPGGILASPFFRLLAINWLIGAFVSVMVLAGLMLFDTANLRSLILNSDEPLLPILVLLFGLMVTLCSAAMGAAIMALPSSEDGGSGRGRRAPALVPAVVRVGAPRGRA